MIRTTAAASFALIAITIPAYGDGPLLIIDRWWGVDYAKVNCEIPAFKPAGKSEATCIQESTQTRSNTALTGTISIVSPSEVIVLPVQISVKGLACAGVASNREKMARFFITSSRGVESY